MFDLLTSARRSLRQFNEGFVPSSRLEAMAAIDSLAAVEKLAAGERLRLLRDLDDDADTVDWLAGKTGQTKRDAERDLGAARSVAEGSATDEALKDGDLSADQAREVASGAAADPSAEGSLLDSARKESMAELTRKAKRVRSAATDDAVKNERAHRERDLSAGVDEETGKGWWHVSGPAAAVARMNSFLEPFIQARFDQARRAGEHERRGAYAFDALLDALGLASGRATGDGAVKPARRKAKILVRVDATALRRGHTQAGETCEIDGLGPVPLAAVQELLPDAAIEVVVTDGENVWNRTNLSRRPSAAQQTILEWLGIECARQGCGATKNLQVDHRIDWAHTHLTELRALEWHCPADHRLKTHHGWALVPGRGRRTMVPPDHPDHPANGPPADAPPREPERPAA